MSRIPLCCLVAIVPATLASCGREAPRSPEGLVEIRAAPITTRGGGTVQARVRFQPAAGVRWNGSFASSARVVESGRLIPERMQFAASDFRPDGDAVVLTIPVSTSKPGPSGLELSVDFSLCRDDACDDFRKVPVQIPFVVN